MNQEPTMATQLLDQVLALKSGACSALTPHLLPLSSSVPRADLFMHLRLLQREIAVLEFRPQNLEDSQAGCRSGTEA